jgi:hypothetical protein
MTRLIVCLLALFFGCNAVLAQEAYSTPKEVKPSTEPDLGPTARDLLRVESSYVFSSELDNDGSFGNQDALQTVFEYSHRFHVTGKVFFRAGFEYERFDFGRSSAPVPNHLQSVNALFSLEYVYGNDIAAFLQVRPGFYTENHFDLDSFDCPITIGRIFMTPVDKLYLLVGVDAAFLRGEFPVFPLVGLIYRPNSQWMLCGVFPEPHVSYAISKKVDLWLGGQFVGGSYRTDHDDNIVPRKLNGAQVDYTEYRAGVSLDFHPSSHVSLNVAAGCAVLRRINFERAGEDFQADPAPYARLAFKAEF